MLLIDYWYGDTREDVTCVDATFYPNDGVWRGNVYSGTQCVGDFVCDDSVELEDEFPRVFDQKGNGMPRWEKDEMYDRICGMLTDYEDGLENDWAKEFYDVLVTIANKWELLIGEDSK